MRLEKPSLKCVDRVHEEMKKAITYCADEELIRELKRFPAFTAKIYNFVHHMLEERTKKTKKSIIIELIFNLNFQIHQKIDFIACSLYQYQTSGFFFRACIVDDVDEVGTESL